MQKILLIGSPGSGKSTIAMELGKYLNLPVLHLDALYWTPNWERVDSQEVGEKLHKLLQQEKWIMDGPDPENWDSHFQAADTLIFLDYHPSLCIYRALKRLFQFRGSSRPDLPEHTVEIDWDTLKGIWYYPQAVRPLVLGKMRQYQENRQVLIFRKPQELQAYIHNINTKINCGQNQKKSQQLSSDFI
ncbi:hypothetical protein IJ00_16660 [Calothrix sp. 336/3]|nr:hypothetical protein [Calothrix sp. 336/3]AKG22686.1 hypothetical protein IJ00_16660 [Calothrix sp. 336/3]